MLALAACAGEDLPPSVWPPADFEFHAEQLVLASDGVQVQRRLRVFADGLVVYGAAADSLRRPVDAGPTVALPVFDRLAVYRLVPDALRAFARRLDRLGIATMGARQGQVGEPELAVVTLHWRAFGSENRVLVQGPVGGPVAELLGVVAAHLPPGERIESTGNALRAVPAVLRGVPEPRADLRAALRVHAELCEERDDESLLLDTFTLACAAGERAEAELWLERYRARPAFARDVAATEPEPRLDAGFLQRFLPPQ